MRRLLIALALVMLLGSLAQAQTTVNLSVTDTPDNQTWNNGTWSVQLIPGPGNLDQTRNFTLLVAGGSLGSQNGSLSSTGTASMSLPANVNIGPVGTKWQFTVCSQQGTACFPANITITTSSPQSVTISPPSIRVTANPNLPPVLVYTTTEISSASIGSQITVVGSTPTTPQLQACTVVSGNACTTWSTTGGTGGGAFDNTINPIQPAYGAKWDAQFTYNAVFTSGSATVTCKTGDCKFTATARAGQIVFGFESPFSANNGVGSYQTLLTQTTITTVNSDTSITVGTTASNSCDPTVGNIVCILVWGTQDDATAINAAANAAWTTPGTCKALQFPTGFALIGGPVMNILPTALSSACGGTVATTNSGIDLTQTGPEVFGAGPGNTLLIPLPNFNYAGCTFGLSTHGCIATTPNLEAHDFGVFGAGQSAPAGNPTVTLFELNGSLQGGGCTGSTGFNLTLTNWAVQDPNATGFDIGNGACGDPTYINNISLLFGGIKTCNITSGGPSGGTVLITYGLACFGNYVSGGIVAQIMLAGGSAQAPGVVSTNGSYFANCGGAASVACVNVSGSATGGIWNSKGDFIACINTSGCTPVRMNGGTGAGTAYLDGDSIAVASGASGGQALWANGASGTAMHVRNSVVVGTGVNTSLLQVSAGNKFFDDGGNQFTNGTVANGVSGNAFGVTNSANGTACATGNFALTSGWGTSSVTSVAANGNILGCHVTITGAAGAAGPVLTWTYPAAPIIAPGSCHLSGGAQGTLTGVGTGAPGATTVAFTFTGTPSAQTYNFDVGCP